MCLIFFGAGVAKLRHAGFAWVTTDTVQMTFVRHHDSHAPPTNIGLWSAARSTLCKLSAACGLAAEVGAPLALLHRRLALFILCTSACFSS